MKPSHHLSHPARDAAIGQGGPVDHDDRQAKLSCRVDLGARAVTTCVLGDDMGDAVIGQQRKVIGQPERPARDNRMGVGQGQGVGLIHQPQQVVVLGGAGELVQMHPANRQKHPRGGIGQGPRRRRDVGDVDPAITFNRLPSLALQRDQRDARDFGGTDGVAAHLGGKGVGGINQSGEALIGQEPRQPFGPAKTARAGWDRLGARRFNPPCVGQNRITSGQGTGQRAGIGGAAKDQRLLGGGHGR